MPRVRAIWARGVPGLVEGLGGGDGVDRECRAPRVAAGGAGCCDISGGAFGGDGSLEFGYGAPKTWKIRRPM